MNVTIRQLRAFVSVAQLGGFTNASVRLHLTQSALSMLVRSLEKELGLALFERTTRSIRLTAEGCSFLPLAERMLVDLHNAVADTRARSEKSRGRLAIAVTSTFAATLLPPALRRYHAQHPEVQVTLIDDLSGANIRRLIQDGEADLGICPLERGAWGLFIVDVLMDDALILACPAKHRFVKRKKVDWQDLQDEPMINFPRGNAVQVLVDSTAVALGLRLPTSYEVTSILTALALAANGLGVAVLPSYARALRNDGAVRYLPLGKPVVKRDLCLLRLRDRAMSPAAQSLVRILLEPAQPLN
ncbi:MAG: LysR substrate-binding domain-containing protein [Burkholderiaceae bacterium]|nr:LysR substrate-binding domain-containing protein [Burkholderiaceae bacterium]